MKNSQTSKTRRQIADEYGITPRTLRRWLKKSNIDLPRRLICPREQDIIYQTFGNPLKEAIGIKPG